MINFGALLSNTSNFLYTYILIALLIFAGLYFTVRTRGVQFRLFPEALRVLGELSFREIGALFHKTEELGPGHFSPGQTKNQRRHYDESALSHDPGSAAPVRGPDLQPGEPPGGGGACGELSPLPCPAGGAAPGRPAAPARAGPGAVEGPGAGRGKKAAEKEKLCFSARVLAGAAALGVAVWLLVFRFQTPIPYSQDIRIQEVEPAFHMKYLGRDYAGWRSCSG